MSTDIKFKAFIKNELGGFFIPSENSDCFMVSNGNGFTVYDENKNTLKENEFSIIQFTGLKDKKGVELFDGDICQYDNNKSMSHWTRGERFVIIKNKGRFSARMKPYDEYDGCNQNTLTEEFEDCITKIGNIFQNPRLLKK